MLSTRNKVGLVIAGLLGVADITAPFTPTPEDAAGPPFGILVLDAVLGVITVLAIVIAWRQVNRSAVRVAAGARIVSMLTALPAFFVDVPAGIKIVVAAFVVLTVVSVALMLSPARQSTPEGASS